MKDLYKKYIINSDIAKVWLCLISENEIDNWGAAPAKIDNLTYSEFELWGGEIWGKNIGVKKESLLVQEWYSGKNWIKPSIVRFKLLKLSDTKTQLELEQKNIPDSEFNDIDKGWDEYYLGAIKLYLEAKNG